MDTWQTVLTSLGIAVLGVLAMWVKTSILPKLGKLINNPMLEKIYPELDAYIDDAINITNKKFVDKLKETGAWDKTDGVLDKDVYKEHAEEALNICAAALDSIMPKGFKKALGLFFEDVKMFLKNSIENRLKEKEELKKAL